MQACWDLLVQPDSQKDRLVFRLGRSWSVTFGNAQTTWNDHYTVLSDTVLYMRQYFFQISFTKHKDFYHAEEHIWLLLTPQTCLQMIIAVCFVQQMFINGLECSLHHLCEVFTPTEIFYIELKLT